MDVGVEVTSEISIRRGCARRDRMLRPFDGSEREPQRFLALGEELYGEAVTRAASL